MALLKQKLVRGEDRTHDALPTELTTIELCFCKIRIHKSAYVKLFRLPSHFKF